MNCQYAPNPCDVDGVGLTVVPGKIHTHSHCKEHGWYCVLRDRWAEVYVSRCPLCNCICFAHTATNEEGTSWSCGFPWGYLDEMPEDERAKVVRDHPDICVSSEPVGG